MTDYTPSLLLQIRCAELPAPQLEYKFHPVRKWLFDCAWVNEKIACEIEGGQFIRGRHNRPDGYEKDCEKYSTAAILNWKVIRVTPKMIEDGRAIKLIELAFERRNP